MAVALPAIVGARCAARRILDWAERAVNILSMRRVMTPGQVDATASIVSRRSDGVEGLVVERIWWQIVRMGASTRKLAGPGRIYGHGGALKITVKVVAD